MLVDASLAPAGHEVLGLEFLIGRKALGWTAVVVLIFATGSFFAMRSPIAGLARSVRSPWGLWPDWSW